MFSQSLVDLSLEAIRTMCDRICLCSQAPTTVAQATATYMLGYRNTPSISVVGAGTGSARRVTVAAITDGVVANAGTATHYALVDVDGTHMVVRPLAASKAVVTGSPWTMDAFNIDAAPDA